MLNDNNPMQEKLSTGIHPDGFLPVVHVDIRPETLEYLMQLVIKKNIVHIG